jgi:hypothetical protein
VFEGILSTCYQAGLLREEERAVTFRLIVTDPGRFRDEEGPPHGFHALRFDAPRPFTADELRRLSPAADYQRSLIGTSLDVEGRPWIWGIVSTGPRWVQAAHGGRVEDPPLPGCLVVCATGPGTLIVCHGSRPVATLHRGCLTCPASEVFGSRWLSETFAAVREELFRLHAEAVAKDGPRRAVDPAFTSRIAQHCVRRTLSAIGSARHGGTLLFLSPETAMGCQRELFLSIKYRFEDAEPRRRFRALMLRIMDAVSRHGSPGEGPAGWDDYLSIRDEELGELDEAIFEVASLLAGLSAVDGAVVLTKRFEILGFGAEISGALPDVTRVERALDSEATQTEPEGVANVGTRHRSVYRLCGRVPDLLGVVVSQDGGVRFVKQVEGKVTYWDQASAGSGV